MNRDKLPDEIDVRQTIAERMRELRLLRSIQRALARHRRDCDQARPVRENEATNEPSDAVRRSEVGRG